MTGSAFGVHLSRFPWELFVTLTFAGTPSDSFCERALRSWLSYLGYCQHRHFGFVSVTERQRRGILHYHLLMLGLIFDPWELKQTWERFGFARVVAYDDRLGASHYLGKYLLKADGQFICSRGLVRYHVDPADPVLRRFASVFPLAGMSEQPTSPGAQAGHRPSDPVHVARATEK